MSLVVGIVTNEKHYNRWYNRAGETPAEQMGRLLAEHRRAGLTFWRAWPLAMAAIRFSSVRESCSWHEVWEDPAVLRAWWASYDRQPNYSAETVGALAGLHDAVGYSEGQSVEPVAWVHGTAAR